MTKRIAALLLALVVLMAFASCSGGNNRSSDELVKIARLNSVSLLLVYDTDGDAGNAGKLCIYSTFEDSVTEIYADDNLVFDSVSVAALFNSFCYSSGNRVIRFTTDNEVVADEISVEGAELSAVNIDGNTAAVYADGKITQIQFGEDKTELGSVEMTGVDDMIWAPSGMILLVTSGDRTQLSGWQWYSGEVRTYSVETLGGMEGDKIADISFQGNYICIRFENGGKQSVTLFDPETEEARPVTGFEGEIRVLGSDENRLLYSTDDGKTGSLCSFIFDQNNTYILEEFDGAYTAADLTAPDGILVYRHGNDGADALTFIENEGE